jgi:DNA-binding XRE family transcriptional regulator
MAPASLKSHRERLGLSQAALSRALGMSKNTIGAYEAGRHEIPLHVALAISALLHGLPPAE